MTRSFIAVTAGTAILLGLQLLAESNAQAFVRIPWGLSLALLGVFLAIVGGVAYRFLQGSMFVRLFAIALMVAAANSAAQLVVGSDQAYPNLRLWLIVPYVLTSWFGATLSICMVKLRSAGTKEGQ
jgi:hypothetical protein